MTTSIAAVIMCCRIHLMSNGLSSDKAADDRLYENAWRLQGFVSCCPIRQYYFRYNRRYFVFPVHSDVNRKLTGVAINFHTKRINVT
jgi:hypothetical protein